MIANSLSALFPGITFGVVGDSSDCALVEHLGVVTIAQWNRPEPQPTQEEIEAAIIPAKRAAVIANIKAERDKREQAGFMYLGKLIDSDPVSCQRIQVAATTAQLALASGVNDFSLDWTCADNTTITLDAMGVLGMIQALGLHGVHTHYYAKALKEQAATSDDPESIDILTGWPE